MIGWLIRYGTCSLWRDVRKGIKMLASPQLLFIHCIIMHILFTRWTVNGDNSYLHSQLFYTSWTIKGPSSFSLKHVQHVKYHLICLQAMTNPIARCPGLVKCDQIDIRASKFSDKNTICIIRGLVTFSIPNFGLVHFKIICQALCLHTGHIR
jgi:hypothetical protein